MLLWRPGRDGVTACEGERLRKSAGTAIAAFDMSLLTLRILVVRRW